MLGLMKRPLLVAVTVILIVMFVAPLLMLGF